MRSSQRPVRIAFCITDLDSGGAERALVQLVVRLDKTKWEPAVFCLSPEGALAATLRDAGIAVKCLGATRRGGWTVAWRLYRELRRCRPALVQTYLYHANIAGRFASFAAGVPHIVSGIRVAEKRSRFRLWLDRATERLVEKHVCVSRAVAAFSIQHGGLTAEKIVVIPNGVDAERFADAKPADLREFGIPPGSRTLLFVGRLDPQKGPMVLLTAMESRLEVGDNVHVLMVGDGHLAGEARDWVREHRAEARVHFAGRRDDVPALLKAATALVLPSLWEGMPNVVLEAMAAGTPVIATAVEGMSDLWGEAASNTLVPPGDPRALGQAIDHLLSGPSSALRIAAKLQDIVRKDFTWTAVVWQYDALYAALLSR